MKETNSNILFSIRPKYIKLILSGEKNYEYRSTYWNVEYPSWFTVYESSPICSVKYFMLLDNPVKEGEKITYRQSYGTDRFNDGEMPGKYAYPILNFVDVENPIPLSKLREIRVTPPQNYIYINRKKELNELIIPEIDKLKKNG